jgi:preprotein translocase subunit SecB
MSEEQENRKQFAIQKLYIKDASFESPDSPNSFSFKQWDPKIDLNLTNNQQHIEGDLYEAVLCLTATVNHQDKTAFLIEVQHAALVVMSGFEEEEKKYLLGSQCMSILFPYAREVISDLSVRGGFPPLILSPVNFDALYQQHIQKQANQEGAVEEASPDQAEATH